MGVATHLSTGFFGGVIAKTQITVAGDFWSLLHHLQFCAVVGQLDAMLPAGLSKLSKKFKYFTLQLDPKEYFGWVLI